MPETDKGSSNLITKSHLLLDGVSKESAAPTASDLLRREYELEQENRNRETILSSTLTKMFGAFRGQSGLDRLRAAGGNEEQISRIVSANKSERLWEHDVAEIGTAVLKTGALFLKGRGGAVATAVIYGLDSVKPGASLGEMAVDGTLGASKGLLNRQFLDWSHNRGWSIGKTGVMLGGFTRLTDSTLTRQTYLDKDGNINLTMGAERIVQNTLNPSAIIMDYALFKVAGAGVARADAVLGGKLSENPLLRNAATGYVFGLSTGFSGEALRQMRENDFDPKRLAILTLTRGFADSVAAMPGGYQAYRAELNAKSAAGETGTGAKESFQPASQPQRMPERIELIGGKAGEPTLSAKLAERTDPATLAEQSLAKTAGEQAAKPVETARPVEAARPAEPARPVDTSEVLKQMGSPELRSEPVHKLKPESERQPSDDYRSWRQLNLETAGERPVEVYKFDNVEIAVPKEYNEVLSQLRLWRGENPGKEMPADHPLFQYRDRALPEDIAAGLRNLPKPDVFRRINVLDEESVASEFLRQKDPSHRSAAESTNEGETNFYKPRLNKFLEEDIFHEWAHIAKWKHPELSYMFDLAAKVEENGHNAHPYAKTNIDENFAVHTAEALGNPDIAQARTFAEQAPLRSAVILKFLKDAMDANPSAPMTPRMEALARNVKELYEPTVTKARAELVKNINETTNDAQLEASVKTLLQIGETGDFAQIQRPIPKLNFTLEPVTPEMIERLNALPRGVQELNFTATNVFDEQLSGIGRIPSLASLTLRRTSITNYGISELAGNGRIPGLKLNLSETAVDGKASGDLVRIKPDSVDLRGTQFQTPDIDRLRQMLATSRVKH